MLGCWILRSGIKSQHITVEKPRPNLVERAQHALRDMIRAEIFEHVENPMKEVDVLLSRCAWALRSTASVASGKTPVQLIHDEDTMTQVAIDASSREVLRQKEKLIEKNNKLENKKIE